MEAVKEISADIIHKETENYLAQMEKENEIIDKQVRELLGNWENTEEDAIKEYDLPPNSMSIQFLESPQKQSDSRFRESSGKFETQFIEEDRDQIYLHQIKYLESQLENSTKTVESLELKLREKDNKIKELESKLTKTATNYSQSPKRDISFSKEIPVTQTAFSASLKRKEREQEKKIAEMESKLIEERKAMQRLHHLNKELLSKIKEIRTKEDYNKAQLNKTQMRESKIRNLLEENQQLGLMSRQQQKRIHELEDELEETKAAYDTLLASSMEFEEKTRDLYRINQVLNENLKSFIEGE
ncbi:unnamed protein product [Blepharisma stoltei]|uniref:Uncharacterized protein n=1 Tax=Blepharisma stoltei TaxID=1481888 RepID=A0AAU9JJY4_9CILI|nr:unnamed protein product [Blepharisma stoltei]